MMNTFATVRRWPRSATAWRPLAANSYIRAQARLQETAIGSPAGLPAAEAIQADVITMAA